MQNAIGNKIAIDLCRNQPVRVGIRKNLISTQICTLNFRSLPPSNCTWNAAQVLLGKPNGALWTSCSRIRIKSVGCGVLLDVGRGDGAVGGRVGGVDGRSVGSAATKTAAEMKKNAKWAI
jgi:hypothetical protein